MANSNDPDLAVVLPRSEWVDILAEVGNLEQSGFDLGELGDAIEHAMARQTDKADTEG